MEALLRQIHGKKARDLSLRGKVLIVKALHPSKFQYLHVIYVPYTFFEMKNTFLECTNPEIVILRKHYIPLHYS